MVLAVLPLAVSCVAVVLTVRLLGCARRGSAGADNHRDVQAADLDGLVDGFVQPRNRASFVVVVLVALPLPPSVVDMAIGFDSCFTSGASIWSTARPILASSLQLSRLLDRSWTILGGRYKSVAGSPIERGKTFMERGRLVETLQSARLYC